MKTDYNYKDIYDLCKKHMHSYVMAEMNDGSAIDGIITGLDNEYVYIAVPLDYDQPSPHDYNERQFGYGFTGGYPGYGYPGYGYHPPRRFRRLVLPLAVLAALSILPWY